VHNSFDESERDKEAFGHWLSNAFSCKKIIHSAFQISVPSIPKILNILKKNMKNFKDCRKRRRRRRRRTRTPCL
jgi:hypothetical protein